jgi:hypothetical protein
MAYGAKTYEGTDNPVGIVVGSGVWGAWHRCACVCQMKLRHGGTNVWQLRENLVNEGNSLRRVPEVGEIESTKV